MSNNLGACKYCDAEIIWTQTRDGRRFTLDKHPERRYVLEKEAPDGVAQVKLVDCYRGHSATCTGKKEGIDEI